ncbi:Outer membrane protein A precursor [Marinobacterium lacunae]|uniref:Outer membrane protein A n=1 Tax=Marinobacterium lacunae TaxID=1232683 RepID=A0A081G3U0_9GAMM|nr:OmpA family protein [Marinobacterium lacunae]KEA65445.1 Outer membrane protein A precursor [Marinobacterium lacunae]MBR9882644.1 OmpA family protein [Oceanospirillales bacterium]
MKKIAIAAGLALAMGATMAQAHEENKGYVTTSNGTIWRTSLGECWHNSLWTKDLAVVGCDGMVAAAPMVEEKPAEPMYAMMADTKKFALYFDFDSTQVGDTSNIVNYIGTLSSLKEIKLVGHADPIGSEAYNEKLSKRRAEAVAAKLADAGVDSSKMDIGYLGESSPIANCSGRGAELIACLRPDRRVDVEIMGEKRVMK